MRLTKRSLVISLSGLATVSLLAAAVAVVSAPGAHATAANPYVLSLDRLQNARPQFPAMRAHGPALNSAHFKQGRGGTCLADVPVDSLTNFCGQYHVAGFDFFGNPTDTWTWDMVGNAPQQIGIGTTTFDAPIIPVKVEFLNPDGSVALTSDPMQDVQRVLNSPVFSYHKYSSGPAPTQFADAIQRAEFFHAARPGWHTLLTPSVKTERVMQVPAGQWFAVRNADGTCCVSYLVNLDTFVNLLFPPTSPVDNTTVLGAAELAGDMTPADITTTLFHSVYLYFGSEPSAPGACCALGFHTIDFELGATPDANFRAYVMDYASWVQPGSFLGTLNPDILVLGHEMAELYNDPFVGIVNLDVTPWWSLNGFCSDLLEVADATSVSIPITMNGFTYHIQNVKLLQWFEAHHTSDAIDGAYSYPDETELTDSSTSQPAQCGA